MMAFIKFMNDSGFIGWLILGVGVASIALIVERVRTLYFHYGVKTDEFMTKIQNLVLAKKIDEALIVCTQLEKKPIASAFKTILEKADRDDETIFQAHDIALSENAPKYTRRLHYLSMMSNVATLMGLLGTIHGLILSFQAVAQADPSQKQALLASGISVSMYTTALGLAVAIPAMVAYSFLISRQNHLLEEMNEKTSKLTELLTSNHLPQLTRDKIFPDQVATTGHSATPPGVNQKVS
ncbi:MAG: MotA/TolQ/ExbB proton channel family protein [Bdellovibrionia bacterium]